MIDDNTMSKSDHYRRVAYKITDPETGETTSQGGKEYKVGYADYDFENGKPISPLFLDK